MHKGAVTISIDLELAWGNWDNLNSGHIHHVEESERPIVQRLVALFDRYDFPVTWAFVAALLDQASATSQPGPEKLWYAPDVIDLIRSAKTKHDMGSHGGRHRYFNSMTDSEAEEEIAFARDIHIANDLPFESFVFPRNKVARTGLLHKHGIQVYRGEDIAWHQRIRSRWPTAGRVANLADKMLPIAPETVSPTPDSDVTNLPGSMLFLGREGIRRFARSDTMSAKLLKGLERAESTRSVFHLWFHPSNFWYEPDTQFRILEEFTARVRERVNAGQIEVRPMNAFG